jgi:hypothetical protein
MDKQAQTRDTVLIKSGEMTGRTQTLSWWMAKSIFYSLWVDGGRCGKDDRKQNTLAPVLPTHFSVGLAHRSGTLRLYFLPCIHLKSFPSLAKEEFYPQPKTNFFPPKKDKFQRLATAFVPLHWRTAFSLFSP